MSKDEFFEAEWKKNLEDLYMCVPNLILVYLFVIWLCGQLSGRHRKTEVKKVSKK